MIYNLYWKTGFKSIIVGSTITNAFNTSMFTEEALTVLDFYIDETINKNYKWNPKTTEWNLINDNNDYNLLPLKESKLDRMIKT